MWGGSAQLGRQPASRKRPRPYRRCRKPPPRPRDRQPATMTRTAGPCEKPPERTLLLAPAMRAIPNLPLSRCRRYDNLTARLAVRDNRPPVAVNDGVPVWVGRQVWILIPSICRHVLGLPACSTMAARGRLRSRLLEQAAYQRCIGKKGNVTAKNDRSRAMIPHCWFAIRFEDARTATPLSHARKMARNTVTSPVTSKDGGKVTYKS
jgi:hypothetical protein